MINVLWMSPYAPYDKVGHAGGQIENYYLKELNKNKDIELFLLSFIDKEEYKDVKIDLASSNVGNVIINNNIIKTDKYLDKIRLFNKYGGIVKKDYWNIIEQNLDENYSKIPDVIVVEWTEFIMFIPEIKLRYPNAKIVSIEEDVTFLKYYRIIRSQSNLLKKLLWNIRYHKLKKSELKSLDMSDIVILNNSKDENLVQNMGIKNTWVWTPYFMNMTKDIKDDFLTKNIVFYGAMARKENHDSVMWFIKNVLEKINDKDVRFIIVGSKPQKELLDLASDRIIVTGFVDSVKPYFQNALCCVAPLVMGAGVKIKVLEAMSAGVPVLTNDIGIEGIQAVDKKDYFHCEKPEQYIQAIRLLINDKNVGEKMGNSSREFISKNYNYEQDSKVFVNKIKNLETIK